MSTPIGTHPEKKGRNGVTQCQRVKEMRMGGLSRAQIDGINDAPKRLGTGGLFKYLSRKRKMKAQSVVD